MIVCLECSKIKARTAVLFNIFIDAFTYLSVNYCD